ncbi:FAD-dependent oxidoreductase [Burkholderia multivorans]|uniref:FAD-dependent oxidoreductase n=3 Tax=Burkholderia TaxID=32008 RepID=A0A8E2USI4_9BURK|nr:FAD-dependent oxidoreductase [Burkholderia multivorans]AJY18134.1 pyridine nucleotide-disulfide oxidoreductase family protein [Burkholderia multivorans ATCC BAA-247]AOJ92686.1 amino acid dehydrogenase [Burkholderia multivorans]AVR22328.1 FAD-dependent oxidoreductase [Burkholderia multivorans]EEE04159.1 putative D-amino acid dehydrogenase, small subunit [Burkholderia multivorans CGD2]EEE14538.1 putative D-amino acid dehydrogenase, small subunit [Burkholderia multivorans CGD2M]
MDVIVIGGGLTGVATAYQLRAAGHRVCVVERHATVAQGATYGDGGALLPSPLDVWFGPTFMHARQPRDSGIVYKPGFDGAVRRFAKRLAALREPDAFVAQYARLRPLIDAAREAVADIENRFRLEFEQKTGILHVVRDARDWEALQPALALLPTLDQPHRTLSADACAALEPSVRAEPDFAGGVLLETERTGNCPLFAKLVKQTLDEHGVQFRFGADVAAIRVDAGRAAVELAPPRGDRRAAHAREVDVISADAVVVAAGTGSIALLERLGWRLPLHPIRVHTLSAPIAYEEYAPHLSIVDSVKRIAITRIQQRLRIGGGAVLQRAADLAKPLAEPLAEAALALLGQAAHDWVPGAAKISAALSWQGAQLLSPDGLPVVGPTPHPRVFVNMGHGPAGWALACGSAKVVTDYLGGNVQHWPADTLAALRAERFTT